MHLRNDEGCSFLRNEECLDTAIRVTGLVICFVAKKHICSCMKTMSGCSNGNRNVLMVYLWKIACICTTVLRFQNFQLFSFKIRIRPTNLENCRKPITFMLCRLLCRLRVAPSFVQKTAIAIGKIRTSILISFWLA